MIKSNFKANLQRAFTLLAVIIVSACAAPKSPYSLPSVSDSDNAARILVKSADNPSNVKFLHLLSVDGNVVMELKESDKASFDLDPGPHTFSVTCHVIPDPQLSGLPTNLSVVDGKAELEANVQPGDELCLKVSKALLTCARLEDSALSQCR